ncbi:MAG: DoxX family protein [Gammaproteobacteria bacterium]
MTISIRPMRVLFAATLIAIGITGIINGDFALGWQDIPLHHVPGRTFLAYLCASIELATGLGLLLKPTLTLTCRILFPYMLLWLVLLELPAVVRLSQHTDAWGSFGEIAIITTGAWCLFAAHAGVWEKAHLNFIVGTNGIRAARLLLIVSLPMIGLEVMADAAKTGNSILPPWLQWLPFPTGWAYLSGVGSFAACLGLLFGVFPRLAATLEAAMLGTIAVVYWGPWLHTGRTATTAFLISWAIAAGVWLVADTYRGVPWLARGRASRGITLD